MGRYGAGRCVQELQGTGNAVPPQRLSKPSREPSTHLTENTAEAQRDREGRACT